jgi:hypothetical protein
VPKRLHGGIKGLLSFLGAMLRRLLPRRQTRR